MRRRKRDHFRSPSISDTEYFSDNASHSDALSSHSQAEQSTSEVDSSNEESDTNTPIPSGSTLHSPSITQLSEELKVPVNAEKPLAETDGGRAWYEFDLAVVLSLLPPIANWLTGGDIVKNILLVLFLVFYLHQIIEGGLTSSLSFAICWKRHYFSSLEALPCIKTTACTSCSTTRSYFRCG